MDKFLLDLEKCLRAEAWYPALFCALTLPDICAKVDNLTGHTNSKFYAAWFDKYVKPRYTHLMPGGECTFLSGADCYALRCAALHEGSDVTSGQRAKENLEGFSFVAPAKGVFHCNWRGNILQLQVDVFCSDIVAGVRDWLSDVATDPAKQAELASLLYIVKCEDGQFGL